ncbi:unnamed protein product [Urochloa decumbens]|uniref:Late embryogenesis abundant protein LEA-2 subgroup domain-containing protein n=1 Tax=Urochloa decumbens TaxID=240449 RepID=A0ABC9GJ28_9POAL
MAEHHLPPEPVVGRKGVVHADDLTRGRRRYYYPSYYYGGYTGGGGGRALCFALLVLLLAAGITWLVLYVVYRPSHPTLAVTSAAVLALYNATNAAGGSPTAVAASFQFTLVLCNPSARSAARYDRLTAYAAYRGQALTPPAPLPPLAQDAGDAVAVAPVLGGGGRAEAVPVSPDTAAALAADAAYGVLAIRVVVLGRVRFVSGPFHRGWHSLYARCDVLLGLRSKAGGGAAAGRSNGGAGGWPQQAALLGEPACNVDM